MELYESSSTSSDEEIIEIVRHIERPRRYLQRENKLEKYGDSEFRDRFRLTKKCFNILMELIGNNLNTLAARRTKTALSVSEQLLLTLRFYATGSFHILIGDDCNVHKTTVCRIVKKVSEEIARLSPRFIKMPQTENEIRDVKSGFYNIRRFPNVIGCVDGTHIPIQSPGGPNAELFRNRKGYFSLNVQAICDSKLLIRDIVARWHGSTHDSTIFNASLICASLEAGEYPGSYLLGDSAYGCKEYLLTPLLNPVTQAEQNYNASHIQTRNSIERTFGVWKRRFACLSLRLRIKLETSLAVIVATAVLHNLAIQENDRLDNIEEVNLEAENVPNDDRNQENNVGGNALRRTLIENYFR